MPTIYIFNTNIILPDKVLKNSSLLIKGSKIISIGRPAPGHSVRINAHGAYLSPGLIDTHIHGPADKIFRNETKHGTTSVIIAISCGRTFDKQADNPFGRNLIGVRLEGPVISRKMAGAQDKRAIKNYITEGMLSIKPIMITLAPETKGAQKLFQICKKRGIMPSLGHSDASYRQAQIAFESGVRHATHLFNAMSGPRHGSAGAGIAALFDPRVTTELIADAKHVRPGLMRLVFAVKDREKTILITDSVRAETSTIPMPGAGRVRGSSHMIDCVRNTVRRCGAPLADAVAMATIVPARFFGLGRRKGSIAKGKDADVILFDKDFNVKLTIINGKIIHKSKDIICAA